MKRRIAWLLSASRLPARLAELSRFVRALTLSGHECVLCVRGDLAPAQLARLCAQHPLLAGCKIESSWSASADANVLLATDWAGAHFAHEQRASRPALYFLLEWEPELPAMGGECLLAENALRLGLPTLALGRGLAERARCFATGPVAHLDFSPALDVFHPPSAPADGEPTIVCALDAAPHRCTGIALQALQALKRTLPSARILVEGAPADTRLPFEAALVDVTSPEQRNELYARAHVGFCLHSAHLTRTPFEMLAAGLPVVDLHGPQNIFDLPDSATRLAAANPDSLATALLELLADPTLRAQLARHARAHVEQHHAERDAAAFTRWVNTALDGHAPAPAPTPLAPRYRADPVRFAAPPDPSLAARTWPLVTYDVWDTVLRRRCHPDEIKLHTARYLRVKFSALLQDPDATPVALMKERVACERAIGQRERLAGADDEYTLDEVLRLWVARVSNTTLPPDRLHAIASELSATEFAQEKRVIYADRDFPALLDTFRATKRCFVSDFYMPAEHLRELLLHAGVPEPLCVGVSSCDARLNKRTGHLLRFVADHFGVRPQDHLHLGDNLYSDVFVPRRLGSASVHVQPPAERARTDALARELASRVTPRPLPLPTDPKNKTKATPAPRPGFAPASLRSLAQLRTATLDELPDPEAMHALGRSFAPLLGAFALYLGEQATRAGLSRLHFFTREGEFFADVYRALAAARPLGFDLPEPVVLEVSRLATFAASLERADPQEFMRLWTLYSTQSPRALFISLDLDPAPLAPLLQKHGLPLATPIQYPWADARLQRFLTDPQVRAILAPHCARKRRELHAYLAGKGVAADQPQIGIVDIGWRGTIQDNLAHALPRTQVHGWYFGMLPLLNTQPANVTKACFGPGRATDDVSTKRLLDFVSPLEMLCNSRHGTTLRYVERDGRHVALRQNDEREEAVFDAFTRHFQAGVLAALPEVADEIAVRALTSAELRPVVLDTLHQLVHQPPRAAARAYFSLNHNETFGVGVFDDKRRYQDQIAVVRRAFDAGQWDAFAAASRQSTWAQGYARLCEVEFPYFDETPAASRAISPAARRAADEHTRAAFAAYRARAFAQARASAIQALALDPWRLRVHHLAYRACLDANLTKDAMLHFQYIKKLHPTHPPTLNEFATRSFRVGLADNARALYEHLVEEHPGYLPALLNLCRLHLAAGKPARALALLDENEATHAESPTYKEFRAAAELLAAVSLRQRHASPVAAPAASPAYATLTAPDRTGLLELAEFAPPADAARTQRVLHTFCAPRSDDAYLE